MILIPFIKNLPSCRFYEPIYGRSAYAYFSSHFFHGRVGVLANKLNEFLQTDFLDGFHMSVILSINMSFNLGFICSILELMRISSKRFTE